MKFKCQKAILQNALTLAARAVPQKSTLPALEGLLLEAEKGDILTVTGYNLETGIVSSPGAAVFESGAIILPARLILDITRKLPDGEISLETLDEDTVRISCLDAEFKIKGIDAEAYPRLPKYNLDYTLKIPEGVLKSMLSKTLFAAAVNENKVIHTGALFDLENGVLSIVTLDGFRLAICRERMENAEDKKFVAPGTALRELEHILTDFDDHEVEITVGGPFIGFKTDGAVVLTRLLDGEFMDYKRSVPKGQPVNLTVRTKTLYDSVDRVSLLINEKLKSPVRFNIADSTISLSLLTAIGSANDVCPCDGDGGGIEIGFNHRYILDALKAALPDEAVKLRLSNPLSPLIIEPEEGEDYLFMVLPVRLNAN